MQSKELQFLKSPINKQQAIEIAIKFGGLGSSLKQQGFWDASTNTPTLTNGTGTIGYYYVISVGGTVNFGAGNITFTVGDWVYYNTANQWVKFETGVDYVPVNKAGDTMTGNLILNADPSNNLGASTKQYVDNSISAASGLVANYVAQAFTSQTSVTVTHNFGGYPAVNLIDASGYIFQPTDIQHTSVNAFTVTFTASRSGTIIATIGSPELQSYVVKSLSYTLTANDYFVEVTTASTTQTLPTAVGKLAKVYQIINASAGDITVNTTSSQTINGSLTITIPANSTLSVVSNNSNWKII